MTETSEKRRFRSKAAHLAMSRIRATVLFRPDMKYLASFFRSTDDLRKQLATCSPRKTSSWGESQI